MTEIDLVIETGSVKALPVSVTTVDVSLLKGRGYLCGWSLRDASGDTTQQTEGSTVAPIAGAVVASIAGLAAGTYDVTWQVSLQGAAAAADANNFVLKNGATAVLNSINAGAAGAYPQNGARIVVPQGGTVSINAIAAGTVGVTYLGQFEVAITLIPNAIADILDGGNFLGTASMPAGESATEWFDRSGIDLQNGITLHVVSGTIKGVVYARFKGGSY